MLFRLRKLMKLFRAADMKFVYYMHFQNQKILSLIVFRIAKWKWLSAYKVTKK